MSSRAATAGLVGLVVLDVVVVGTALWSTRTSGIDTSPVGSASTPVESLGVAVRPSVPLQVILTAVNNRLAWRARAGSCSGGGATLATTVDGGRTWAEVKAPMRTIVRLHVAKIRVGFVVGADSRCAAVLKETHDSGRTWSLVGKVRSEWFRDPKNPSVVQAPGPSASQPCGKRAVLDLALLSASRTRVLCADGLVRSTTNYGSVWSDWGKVAGAVALAVPSDNPAQTYVARQGVPGCAGVQIRRVGPLVATTSCIRTAMPTDPGQIALSLVKGGGWLAVGDTTMRSTDGLVTWSAS